MENTTSELADIRERNKRVELDKAWETSKTRRVFIVIITYIVASAWMVIIHESAWYYKALIPVAGYVLSTLSLPPLKKWWIQKHA